MNPQAGKLTGTFLTLWRIPICQPGQHNRDAAPLSEPTKSPARQQGKGSGLGSGDKTWRPRGALSRRTQRGGTSAPDTMGDVGCGAIG